MDDILAPFLSKLLRFVIIALSVSVIAQEFNYDVNGFVAGLGLGGLAFALAAKAFAASAKASPPRPRPATNPLTS